MKSALKIHEFLNDMLNPFSSSLNLSGSSLWLSFSSVLQVYIKFKFAQRAIIVGSVISC